MSRRLWHPWSRASHQRQEFPFPSQSQHSQQSHAARPPRVDLSRSVRRFGTVAVVVAVGMSVPAAASVAEAAGPFARAATSSGPVQPPPGKLACLVRPGASVDTADAAAAFGLSPERFAAGLSAAKRAGGRGDAAVAAFARAAGTSRQFALKIVTIVFGDTAGPAIKPRTGPRPKTSNAQQAADEAQISALLAEQLGVSRAAAARAVRQLADIDRASGNGLDPSSAAFRAVASGLGVTSARLAGALRAVKLTLAPARGAARPSAKERAAGGAGGDAGKPAPGPAECAP